MREIRVAWPFGLHENQLGEPIEIVVEAGNEACGLGTHWLEEREA